MTSSMDSQLPETSKTLIPLPKSTKKRRRELTNAQHAEIRDFCFHDPNRKPSQKEIIQWFENEHYHTLTQGQVSKILSLDPPKFSTGWLAGFKVRHNIKRRTILSSFGS